MPVEPGRVWIWCVVKSNVRTVEAGSPAEPPNIILLPSDDQVGSCECGSSIISGRGLPPSGETSLMVERPSGNISKKTIFLPSGDHCGRKTGFACDVSCSLSLPSILLRDRLPSAYATEATYCLSFETLV